MDRLAESSSGIAARRPHDHRWGSRPSGGPKEEAIEAAELAWMRSGVTNSLVWARAPLGSLVGREPNQGTTARRGGNTGLAFSIRRIPRGRQAAPGIVLLWTRPTERSSGDGLALRYQPAPSPSSLWPELLLIRLGPRRFAERFSSFIQIKRGRAGSWLPITGLVAGLAACFAALGQPPPGARPGTYFPCGGPGAVTCEVSAAGRRRSH